MSILNRKKQPDFHTIEKIDILPTQREKLSNDIPVYYINAGSQEIVKIEIIFDAGVWYQELPIVAAMTNSMLNEGTRTLTASEIAEKLDYCGAEVGFTTSQHTSSITLYSLNKHLCKTLPVVEDVIKNSIFPEKEFAVVLNNKKQSFVVEHKKPKVLANDCFNALLYGDKHPYANVKQVEDFDRVTPQKLREFHKKYYTPSLCRMIVAGKVGDETKKLLDKHFGQSVWNDEGTVNDVTHEVKLSVERKKIISKPDAVQSAICVGLPLFNKTHPDFIGMQMLNTILGGYFGSRLMSNIREDKGYTYGIGSLLVHYPKGGHFVIMTEVGTDFCKPTLNEIYHEIDRLKGEMISQEELKLVKNYIAGEVLRHLNGPFSLSDSLKENLPYGMDNSYYMKYLKEVKEISAERIQELANTYLQRDNMFEVVAGKLGNV